MPVATSPLNTNEMPAISKDKRIASRLFLIGTRRPFSKSLIVDSDMFALSANSLCVQSSHPRAARLCSGDIMESM